MEYEEFVKKAINVFQGQTTTEWAIPNAIEGLGYAVLALAAAVRKVGTKSEE